MITIDELNAKWSGLRDEPQGSVYQGYDSTHPLQFFIGLDSAGRREFFVIIRDRPTRVPVNSRSIQVSCGSRRDGTYTLVFKLIEEGQLEVFTHLCWDLAERSRLSTDNEKGLAIILARYALWQRLMEKGNNGLLSEQELKGLFGEIYFMKTQLLGNYGAEEAVAGWVGPSKADRDFIYTDYWYEVKTTNTGAPTIKISSIEQLDTDQPGRIAWLQADKTASTDPHGLTLPQLIKDISLNLEGFPMALEIFSMRILESGYIKRQEYDDIYFVCRSARLFNVAEGFPRLRRKDLNTGIITASYSIGVAEIAAYELAGEV